MKIRIASDIHLELYVHKYAPEIINSFLEHILPPLSDDKDSMLVLAGDIINYGKSKTFDYIVKLSERFKHIILVGGNHEYYGCDLKDHHKFLEFLTENNVKNVHYFRSGYSMMTSFGAENPDDTITVIGATLWTDFDNNNPVAKAIIQNALNDYRMIKKDGSYIKPDDILEIHNIEMEWILHYLEGVNLNKTLVVTHHGPFLGNIHPKYKNSGLINYAFASDLSKKFVNLLPAVWIAGHTHSKIDYMQNQCRVIANPVGYANLNTFNLENKEYDPTLTIEL